MKLFYLILQLVFFGIKYVCFYSLGFFLFSHTSHAGFLFFNFVGLFLGFFSSHISQVGFLFFNWMHIYYRGWCTYIQVF